MNRKGKERNMKQSDIGMIGLAVMGKNLILNMESNGFAISVYNRTMQKVTEFLEELTPGQQIIGAFSIEELVFQLKKPRRVMLMVKAGPAVDELISELIPFLEPGDIIIDGGNSRYTDTMRRILLAEGRGLYYVGAGISGGEEGALNGPSIMPGGTSQAWEAIKPIFQTISAKATDGLPCCDWIGSGGAGHFVKMVHNGIEYGDIQLICEAYHLLRENLGFSPDEIHRVFLEWNQGELNSYLIEITGNIFAVRDSDGTPIIDKILDVAGQKGTGKWTVEAALEEGVPVTLISEALFSRSLSALKEERVRASQMLSGPSELIGENRKEFLSDIRDALFAAKITSYAQGFALLKKASGTYGWNLNYAGIARLWRGGCIIRSTFLENIAEAFDRNPSLDNLLLDEYFRDAFVHTQNGFRRVCATASLGGIPVPAMSAALSYYDGYRSSWLPANLLQAQRDYFGAHTYERTDAPRGTFYHINWTGKGGTTTSGTYDA